MLSWTTIFYGAALSAVAAAVLVAVARRRREPMSLAAAGFGAAAGALLWNAILHRVHASEFFVDAPIGVLPASWQDTGSGVFAVAVSATVFGMGPLKREAAQTVALIALLCGLAAFLVDVYLY
jgi:hypothetical protein